MISTRHTAEMVTYINRKGQQTQKPLAVHKAGVDLADQHMSYGSFDHWSMKWWRKLALHLIMMSVVNACVLYKDIKGKGLSVMSMIDKICNQLVLHHNEENATGGSSGKKTDGTSYTAAFPREDAMCAQKDHEQLQEKLAGN